MAEIEEDAFRHALGGDEVQRMIGLKPSVSPKPEMPWFFQLRGTAAA
jgi:hypothetical protein